MWWRQERTQLRRSVVALPRWHIQQSVPKIALFKLESNGSFSPCQWRQSARGHFRHSGWIIDKAPSSSVYDWFLFYFLGQRSSGHSTNVVVIGCRLLIQTYTFNGSGLVCQPKRKFTDAARNVTSLKALVVAPKRNARRLCRGLGRDRARRFINSNVNSRHHQQQNFCVHCRSSGGIVLPAFVLVRVCIVTDTSDDYTRMFIHNACSLHLEADGLVRKINPAAECSKYLQLIARGDVTKMHKRLIQQPCGGFSPLKT